MHALIQYQARMAAFVSSGHPPQSWGPILQDEYKGRLGVHRNNFLRGVIDALASSYPAVQRIVGSMFFDNLAAAFIAEQPPLDRTLVGYGVDLPLFLSRWEPVAILPYLPDLARLDRAFLEAAISGDDHPLEVETVAALAFDDLVALAPGLLASARIIRIAWDVYDIWTANRDEAPVSAAMIHPGNGAVLLGRPGLVVAHAKISNAEATFLEQVGAGKTILAALETAMDIEPAADPTQLIANAFQTRIFKGRSP